MTQDKVEKVKGKGNNPNSRKNLKSYEPGCTAHPNAGRPKGSLSLKERMDKYINLPTKVVMPDGTITDKEVMDSIVLALLSKARKGDVSAAKEILDRYYGKEASKVELTGSDGQPVAIEHTQRLSEVQRRFIEAFTTGPGLPAETPPTH